MKRLNCILLVDDYDPFNFLNKKLIEKMDIVEHIQVATCGEEALAYLINSMEKNGVGCPDPDLIFIDINMPRMNGWEFLEHYRQQKLNTRDRIIVMLTSSLRPDDEFMAKSNGDIAAFHEKPLTQQMIEQIWEHHFLE